LANIELNKTAEWATDSKIKFNEEKSKSNAADVTETKGTKEGCSLFE